MLKVQQVFAGYGKTPVLHGVDLHVDASEAVAVVGANGAGKTTLVRALCGLLMPSRGTIVQAGDDITRMPAHLRSARGIAVVLEGRNLFTELTVQENLALAARAGRKATARRRAAGLGAAEFAFEDVFELFPVVAERRASKVGLLSGGQQQMVAIARALLLQPSLLVIDEMTTGLAPKVVKEILSALGELKKRGLALLLVEQSVAIAAQMTDRAYVLSVGRVVHEVAVGGWPAMLADPKLVKAYLHG